LFDLTDQRFSAAGGDPSKSAKVAIFTYQEREQARSLKALARKWQRTEGKA